MSILSGLFTKSFKIVKPIPGIDYQSRINSLENELKALKDRVYLLENPYKFEIGERVKYDLSRGNNQILAEGIIIRRTLNHNKYYSVWLIEDMYEIEYAIECNIIKL
jgi:hypothetical protein